MHVGYRLRKGEKFIAEFEKNCHNKVNPIFIDALETESSINGIISEFLISNLCQRLIEVFRLTRMKAMHALQTIPKSLQGEFGR